VKNAQVIRRFIMISKSRGSDDDKVRGWSDQEHEMRG